MGARLLRDCRGPFRQGRTGPAGAGLRLLACYPRLQLGAWQRHGAAPVLPRLRRGRAQRPGLSTRPLCGMTTMKTRITAAGLLGVMVLLCALPLQAQQADTGQAASQEQQEQAQQQEQEKQQEPGQQQEQETANERQDGGESQKGNAQFRPSEQISDDLSVSFPVDI